jgi:hypothetical protein
MSAQQHIEWLSLVEKTGPFLAVGVLDEAFPQGLDKVQTRTRQRIRSAYEEWREAVDEADPQLNSLHREWVRLVMEELLEYDATVLKPTKELPDALSYREPLTGAEVKPSFAVVAGDNARLLIACYAPDSDLSAPMAGESWAASPVERMIALCRATAVKVGLLTDGEQWTLVSVPPESGSSIATWYARMWQQETVTLQAFVSLLQVRRCFGPAEETLDSLFQRSLEHQQEVTDTLGEQVRRAVEVLVQALDRADVDRDRVLLRDVSPPQLYEAGLTIMMRLVVLLCAEERKLLLLGEPIYDQDYAVSTLRSRLRDEKDRFGDEVLERRHDAWSRLLAVFRAVFGGIEHETLRLPALGGSLFDPDRFPFLEGRAAGTSWREVPATPLPIDNRTVLMLLTALQVLEQRSGAQLLSYEALDVEQIGHVYEGLLERTVTRVLETTLGLIGSQKAVNPNTSLRELEAANASGEDKLLAYLVEKTGRSEQALKNALAKKIDEALYHRVLFAINADSSLADRIRPFVHLVRTDSWGDPLVYRKDSFIVTLGAGRRETGTHYTPKSLTEPIVQHTLEPLAYIGPVEGKPQQEWKLKSPIELLALKVCDMAMGSGAFLVQTCRWFAERLVEAWDAEEKAGRVISIEGVVLDQADDTELLPRDRAERLLIARRLIASRCLYGVDINPMAVELAKLSLWLITMMRNRPFSFLDHALKCGDSLLGVSQLKQLERFSLRDPDHAQPLLEAANLWRDIEQAAALRRELETMPSHTAAQIAEKARLHVDAETQLAKLHAAADFLVAAELDCADGRGWDTRRAVAASHLHTAWKKDISEFQRLARKALNDRKPFHWPLEFPELFEVGSDSASSGFDAFVGNPPFMGGKKISGELGSDYRTHLVEQLASGQRGHADLCAYFFLRVESLLNPSHGMAGLVATNSIAEGDTREVGLERLIGLHTTIPYAVSSRKWPGSAALQVAHVWLRKGPWHGEFVLNEKRVSGITAFLTEPSRVLGKPRQLVGNARKAFQGSIILGLGFVLSPEEAAVLIRRDNRNRKVLFPYLNGEDLNSRPDQSPTRWIVNFFDWPLERTAKGSWAASSEARQRTWLKDGVVPADYPKPVAADFPLVLEIVRERVKPERDLLGRKNDASAKGYAKYWWLYARRSIDFYAACADAERVFASCRVTKHLIHTTLPITQVFDGGINLIRFLPETEGIVHSNIYEIWVREYASSLETRLRYTLTDCFETFPFPAAVSRVSRIGNCYEEHRRHITTSREEGLTKTYNRLHSPNEMGDDIAELRNLNRQLDAAVAAAYGWTDLAVNDGAALRHEFYETKQGPRWTVHPNVRRDILDRLLMLNHQRFAEEVAGGLHDKKRSVAKSKRQSPSESLIADLL